MLGFSIDQFAAGFEKGGDLQNAIDEMRWGADYLVSAHSAPNRFVAVVGNYTIDFQYFGPVSTTLKDSIRNRVQYIACIMWLLG